MRLLKVVCVLAVIGWGSALRADEAGELRAILQILQKKVDALEPAAPATSDRVTEIGGAARRQPAVEEVSKLVVRIYDLSDLFTIAPPYVALHSSDLRSAAAGAPSGLFQQTEGSPPTGSGFGGGVFNVGEGERTSIPPTVLPQVGGFGLVHAGTNDYGAGRISFDDLIDAITGTIEPEAWADSGGEATIQSLGNSLIVRATPDTHKQVDNLLNLFRQKWGTLRTVSIEAWWLWMPEAQSQAFLADNRPKGENRGVFGAVDNAAFTAHLGALAKSDTARPGYRATITCYNGQVVHTIAGGQQLFVTDIVPVVDGGDAIGFRPVVSLVQEGAALQVRPNATRAGKYVALDVHSRVNLLSPSEKAAAPAEPQPEKAAGDDQAKAAALIGPDRTVAALDRPRMRNARLSTSLRVPIDQTMLVGAMSFDSDPQAGSENLYLFVKLAMQELRDDQPEAAAGEALEPK